MNDEFKIVKKEDMPKELFRFIPRDIKFKVWDYKRKVMAHVTISYHPYWVKSFIPDGKKHDFYEEAEGEYYLRSNYELIQYTGLKDKNGKEIYEFDIVNIPDENEKNLFKIIFHHGCFVFSDNSEFFTYPEMAEMYGIEEI